MDYIESNVLVTVVVVSYNHENYIVNALDSVINQKTSFNYEVVVADDCSKDSTVMLCKEVEHTHTNVKVIERNRNLGLVNNLFDAFNNYCIGEYIAILAGDDFWKDENKLQKQIDYLQIHSDCSCVHTGYVRDYVKTGEKELRSTWDSPLLYGYGKTMANEVLKENFTSFPVASSVVFRKNNLISYKGFIEAAIKDPFARGEGMILFPVFALNGKFAYLSEPLVTYRIFPSSASHFTDEKTKEKFNIFYLYQKLNTIRLLELGMKIKFYFNIKVIKNFLIYANKSTPQELRDYLKQYKDSPTYNLYPGVDKLIRFGLCFKKN